MTQENKDIRAQVCAAYSRTGSIEQTARMLNISPQLVKIMVPDPSSAVDQILDSLGVDVGDDKPQQSPLDVLASQCADKIPADPLDELVAKVLEDQTSHGFEATQCYEKAPFDTLPDGHMHTKKVVRNIPAAMVSLAKNMSEGTYVATQSHACFYHDGEVVTASSDNRNYHELLKALMNNDFSRAKDLAQLPLQLVGYSRGLLAVRRAEDNFAVTYAGHDLPSDVATEIIRAATSANEYELEKLSAFVIRLLQNPSYTAVRRAFAFIKAKDIKITNDGLLMCYKNVADDFKDIYSGTFDNSPGQLLQMNRWMVDDDHGKTCSSGLHVCSKSYLSHYGKGQRTVRCLVDPADIVSIPTDYNDAKMRCCRYYVLDEVKK
ncbi:RIIB lysis inhibitor [Vibrio phage EniLVp02]